MTVLSENVDPPTAPVPLPRLPRPRWGIYLPLALVWLGVGLLLTSHPDLQPRYGPEFVYLGYVVLPLCGSLAALRRALLYHGPVRGAWLTFAAAFVSWALGGSAWLAYEVVLKVPPPFPSLADVAFVSFSLLAAGALGILTSHWGQRLRAQDALDAAFFGVATAMAAWTLVLEPYLRADAADRATNLAYLAYPAADVALLTVVLLALSRSTPGRTQKVALLAAGFGVLAVADALWLVGTAAGTYEAGRTFDLLWHLAFMLVVCGIIHPPRPTQPAIHRPAVRPWLPLLLCLAVVGLMAKASQRPTGLHNLEVVLVAILLLLLVLRQTVALAANERLRTQVERANAQLVEAAAFKAHFINATAHELANPLTPLKIHTRLLLDPVHEENPQKRRASAALIARNIDRLLRLVQDLLELARLEGGTMSVRSTRTEMRDLVEDAVRLHQASAAERGVQIELRGSQEAPVVTDPQRVAQVLSNLLHNAVKYSPEGGRVTVELARTPSHVSVTVTDQGPGLTPDQTARLFRPFAQVQGAGVQKAGTGLGLYICRMIADRLGGRLDVRSQGPGAGATFLFELPTAARSARGDAA